MLKRVALLIMLCFFCLWSSESIAAEPADVLSEVGLAGGVTTRVIGADEYERYVRKPNSTDFAQRVVALCNMERVKKRLKWLSLDAELQNVAQIRARELTQSFSHTRPNGTRCFSLYPSGRRMAENIAAGSETPERVVAQWMSSPGHRANIMNPKLRRIGVGYAYFASGQYLHYWVQCFSS